MKINPTDINSETASADDVLRFKDGEVQWDTAPSGGDASYPDFTGNAGKVLTVNSTADGVEWDFASGGSGAEVGPHRYWGIVGELYYGGSGGISDPNIQLSAMNFSLGGVSLGPATSGFGVEYGSGYSANALATGTGPWASKGPAGAVMFDYGSPKSVDGLTLTGSTVSGHFSQGPSQFSVICSDDGKRWKRVAEYSNPGNFANGQVIDFDVPTVFPGGGGSGASGQVFFAAGSVNPSAGTGYTETWSDTSGCTVTRAGAGFYDVVFDTPAPDEKYAILYGAKWDADVADNTHPNPGISRNSSVQTPAKSVNGFRIIVDTTYDGEFWFACGYPTAMTALLGGGGGGDSNLPALSGAAGKVLTVKSDESGTEWDEPSAGSAEYPDFVGNAGKHLAVKLTEDGVEWTTDGVIPLGPNPHGSHRYWRVIGITGNGRDDYVLLSELYFYDTPTGDALPTNTGTYLESGHYGSTTGANAFDGDVTNFWESQSGANLSKWVGYDFGTKADGSDNKVPVVAIGVYQGQTSYSTNEFLTSGIVQWSDDNTTWNDAWSFGRFTWPSGTVLNKAVSPYWAETDPISQASGFAVPPLTGEAGRVLAVNSDETGWEWQGLGTAITTTALPLANPGAETGDMTGWSVPTNCTAFVSAVATTNAAGTTNPHSGTTMFGAGTGAAAGMYQDVDVSAHSDDIDKGLCMSVGRVFTANDYSTSEQSWFSVAALDASGAVLARDISAVNNVALMPATTWSALNASLTLPAGTRTLRIQAVSLRLDGTNNDNWFDDFSLNLLTFGSGSSFPVRTGNAGKMLVVKADESGLEWDSRRKEIAGFFTTTPTLGETLTMAQTARAFTIPANMAGTEVSVGTNPHAAFTLSVNKNGAQCGTIAISTTGVVTLSTTGEAAIVFDAGDLLSIVAPTASVDTSVSNVAYTLLATLN